MLELVEFEDKNGITYYLEPKDIVKITNGRTGGIKYKAEFNFMILDKKDTTSNRKYTEARIIH